MNPSTVRELATRLVMVEHGHDLEKVLAGWKGEGVSLRGIATRLGARYGVHVTHTTVKSWLGYPG